MDKTYYNFLLYKLAEQYAIELKDFFKERLYAVVLYGSVARKEASLNSDIDMFIVIEGLPSSYRQRLEALDIVDKKIEGDLMALLKQGIVTDITPYLQTPEEAKCTKPIYLDMVEDAVVFYEKDNFFSAILEELRKRLKELGSRRLEIEGVRYWELKPDYVPGETFSI
jgi:predicted nucleotidyltransferase